MAQTKRIYKGMRLLWATLVMAIPAAWADSQYQDSPMGITATTEQMLAEYTQQARSTLPTFNKKFAPHSGNTFYITTRLYAGDFYENVFVKLQKIEPGQYTGTIASQPQGKVKFNAGDTIVVKTADVTDWLIVTADGEEEGNLTGKALDLMQTGKAVLIAKMIPKEGKFNKFEVVAANNPRTRQPILELVPAAIKSKVEAHLTHQLSGTPAADNKEKFTYTLVEFPGWEIIEEGQSKTDSKTPAQGRMP